MNQITSLVSKSFVVVIFLVVLIPSAWAADSWLSSGLDALNIFSSDSDEQVTLDSLSIDELSAGLREALSVGTERVTARLSVEGGYSLDSNVRISLPEELIAIRTALARVGMEGMMDGLEDRINSSAVIAAPALQEIFLQEIAELILRDLPEIYRGEQNAATDYFKDNISTELLTSMEPVIQKSLLESGTSRILGQIIDRYQALPLAPEVDVDINAYLIEQTMIAFFHCLAEEETEIRNNLEARNSDLLRMTFGAL